MQDQVGPKATNLDFTLVFVWKMEDQVGTESKIVEFMEGGPSDESGG